MKNEGGGVSPEEFSYLLERLRCYYPEAYALFEERASIMQWDGGLSKEESEVEAYRIISEGINAIQL